MQEVQLKVGAQNSCLNVSFYFFKDKVYSLCIPDIIYGFYVAALHYAYHRQLRLTIYPAWDLYTLIIGCLLNEVWQRSLMWFKISGFPVFVLPIMQGRDSRNEVLQYKSATQQQMNKEP